MASLRFFMAEHIDVRFWPSFSGGGAPSQADFEPLFSDGPTRNDMLRRPRRWFISRNRNQNIVRQTDSGVPKKTGTTEIIIRSGNSSSQNHIKTGVISCLDKSNSSPPTHRTGQETRSSKIGHFRILGSASHWHAPTSGSLPSRPNVAIG